MSELDLNGVVYSLVMENGFLPVLRSLAAAADRAKTEVPNNQGATFLAYVLYRTADDWEKLAVNEEDE